MTNNHQEKNARVLSDNGAAILMLEKDCSAEKVYEQIKTLLADADQQKAMRIALRKLAVLDSAERICSIAEQLTTKNRN